MTKKQQIFVLNFYIYLVYINIPLFSVGQLDNLVFWTSVQNPVQNLSKTKTFFHWTGFGQIT
jgi:hypothetical protein